MSAEVAEAIRQTRRTLAEKTWVPRMPKTRRGEVCVVTAMPDAERAAVNQVCRNVLKVHGIMVWNDRQTDVGAVLGMTLQALIAELCKPTLAPRTTEA